VQPGGTPPFLPVSPPHSNIRTFEHFSSLPSYRASSSRAFSYRRALAPGPVIKAGASASLPASPLVLTAWPPCHASYRACLVPGVPHARRFLSVRVRFSPRLSSRPDGVASPPLSRTGRAPTPGIATTPYRACPTPGASSAGVSASLPVSPLVLTAWPPCHASYRACPTPGVATFAVTLLGVGARPVRTCPAPSTEEESAAKPHVHSPPPPLLYFLSPSGLTHQNAIPLADAG